jgi:hypothetical protein
MNLKNTILLLMLVFISLFTVNGQELKFPDLDKSPMDAATYPRNAAWRNYLEGDAKNTPLKIKVTYCRPKKNERVIFGELVKYGEDWRLGANEATEVFFANPVEIGGTFIDAGYYTMFAEVHPAHWVIKISTERHIGGTANRDVSKDIVHVSVPVMNMADSRESFTIGFQRVDDDHCNMVFEWDRTRTVLPISFNPVFLAGDDASPMDLVQYPNMSRLRNYVKPEELAENEPKVRVVYSRPQKKGRVIFGDLLKYGEPWRLGANETTEITFFDDVTIGGKEVKKGKYGIMVIPNADKWEFVIHTGIPSWGTFGHDDATNIASVTAPVSKSATEVEALSIVFDKKDAKNVDMVVAWDKTQVRMPIVLK